MVPDGGPGPVFTIHDPATLAIRRTVPAPSSVGAVAWDGSGYWAATRKNTPDEPVPSQLHRLDRDLRVTSSFPAPAGGCQGLAWDGASLWWADVFDDALLQLDVSGAEPSVLSRRSLAVGYPSGLAWDDRALWLVEYDDDGLHRLAGAAPDVVGASQDGAPGAPPPLVSGPAPEQEGEVEQHLASVREGSFATVESARRLQQLGHEGAVRPILREMLFSDDTFERMRAAEALKALGLPVDRARRRETSPDTGPESTDLVDLRAWVQDGELHASWAVHVGESLFDGIGGEAGDGMLSMPTFARYEIGIEGGTMGEIERAYDATPGLNERSDEVLVTDLGPGTYQVSVFIHVQRKGSDGELKILNDSAGWVELSL